MPGVRKPGLGGDGGSTPDAARSSALWSVRELRGLFHEAASVYPRQPRKETEMKLRFTIYDLRTAPDGSIPCLARVDARGGLNASVHLGHVSNRRQSIPEGSTVNRKSFLTTNEHE